MIKKPSHSHEYEEINLIDYIRTIKKHFSSLVSITIGTMVLALLTTLLLTDPLTYRIGASVELGMSGGTLIEERASIIGFIESSFTDIQVTEREFPNEINITIEGRTEEETKQALQELVTAIRERQKTLHEKIIESREEKMQALKSRIQENESLLVRYQQMIDRLSPSHEAQAIALQGYVTSYGSTLEKINRLKDEFRTLESRGSEYKEPSLKHTPSLTTSGESNILIGLIGGFLLGLLLGIFWAFAKEWWETNKRYLS